MMFSSSRMNLNKAKPQMGPREFQNNKYNNNKETNIQASKTHKTTKPQRIENIQQSET
jgi:hypothetical protein